MTLKRKLVAVAAAVVVLVVGTAGTSYAVGRDKGARIPACVTEDSGPNPCYWDSTTRGNGKGTSFILFNGQVFQLAGTVD